MGLTDFVKGAIGSVKDSGAAAAINRWLSREMADYGEVLDFKIDSRGRSAEVQVLLKGEREKLAINIEEYEIVTGPEDYIVVKRARASREWVNAVMRNFLINKRHKIPSQYSSMVKLVLNG
ncbi:MAG TPA: hypothetical protein VK633_03230 [Verrucomicrobiae bacterium]|nr:hypothetical protein [Verrucomicrobiae bacterium]